MEISVEYVEEEADVRSGQSDERQCHASLRHFNPSCKKRNETFQACLGQNIVGMVANKLYEDFDHKKKTVLHEREEIALRESDTSTSSCAGYTSK